MTVALPRAGFRLGGVSIAGAFLAAGFVALAAPTAVSLADQTWSHEFGAYGPIVLVTGLWLLWRQIPELRRSGQPGSLWLTLAILAASLISYVFGKAYDFVTLEAAGLYGVGLAILQARVGVKVLMAHW